MTQIRTYGRYPTIGEMKAYYDRDDVLEFLYAECRLRSVHATFGDYKLPLTPKSKAHLRALIDGVIKSKIETGYQHDDEPGYILRIPIEVISDLNNYEPVNEPLTPGHTVLWHGTSQERANSIKKQGFSAHSSRSRKVWFTTDFHLAASIAQGRRHQGTGTVLRCEVGLDKCPAIKREKSDIYTFETSHLAFHSAATTIIEGEVTKFDLIFEADLRGWRASFEALSGAIQSCSFQFL